MKISLLLAIQYKWKYFSFYYLKFRKEIRKKKKINGGRLTSTGKLFMLMT